MVASRRAFKVLVTDPIDSSGIEILSTIATVDVKTKLTEAEMCNIIGEYDALMIRSGTTVTEAIINKACSLKIIGRAGVGVDNVDVKAATQKGIFVVNSPEGNTVAAAEHTLALMLSVSRCIPAADLSMRSRKWDRSKFMGTQLQHKTLGIIGLGQVGTHVARVAGEMGMSLMCYDPFVTEEKAASVGCTITTLENLFQNSDYITLHVPLIESTRNLIRKETIELMKRTARVINVSRGGVVNEVDLCAALRAGKLAGAALDVFENEAALPENSPLLDAPNLIMTPHLGASTMEAQVNVAVDVAHQVKATLLGNLPQSAVNIPGVRPSEVQNILPLLRCCESLGGLASKLLGGPVEHITVTLEGPEFGQEKGDTLLMAVANGVMETFVAHRVNFVNVRQITKEHKIQMSVIKETFHSKNAIKVELRNKANTATLSGTTTEDGEVLLKSFKNIPVYMVLPCMSNPDATKKDINPCIFYSIHRDTPGTLSAITRVLEKHGINIANCYLGRSQPENGVRVGVCLFLVDSVLDKTVIQNILEVEAVMECAVCLP